MSPSLAVHPSTALNGPVRLNGALRNGSQFSWSAGRHSAKAVCESLLLGGFHLLPSAPEPWGGGLPFLAPSVPVLHGGGHRRLSDLCTCSGTGCSLLIPHRPGCSRCTALRLQMCKGTGKPCSCACGCSVHTTLPGAGVIHKAAHLLCRNAELQFNSLSSKFSLSGDR